MKDSLAIGLEHQLSVVVTEDLSPRHLLPVLVLSTPNMIGLMEGVCLECVQPHLAATETTVGVHVNVSHQSAAKGDELVIVRCRLVWIERRRLTFEVSAKVEDRVVGEGTHDRFVIDRTGFG